MCKIRYFARLKILFLVCQKGVSAMSSKAPSLKSHMSVALPSKSWNNTGALLCYINLENLRNHRQTRDSSCTCSAFKKKQNTWNRQSTVAFLLYLCSASCVTVSGLSVCECVYVFSVFACCCFAVLGFFFAVLDSACLCC